MTGDEALKRLSEIEAAEFKKLQGLARDIATDARKPATALTGAWAAGQASDQQKAETVLADLGELAVRPWILAGQAVAAGRAYLGSQQRIVEKLTGMFESQAPVPPPPAAGQTEEKEPPSRECDEAYLFARRLLKADDPEELRALLRKEFLFMPAAKRDAEIASFRKTGKWAALLEDATNEPQNKP
jgi:hypothetical protein